MSARRRRREQLQHALVRHHDVLRFVRGEPILCEEQASTGMARREPNRSRSAGADCERLRLRCWGRHWIA